MMHGVLCTVHCALCIVHCAVCIVHYALYIVHWCSIHGYWMNQLVLVEHGIHRWICSVYTYSVINVYLVVCVSNLCRSERPRY